MDVTTQSGESEHFPNYKMSDTVKLLDLKGNPIDRNSQGGGGGAPEEEDPKPAEDDPKPAEDDPKPEEDDPKPEEDDSCPACIDAPEFSEVAS